MSSSSSPCAACKFLRRKCTQGCVFAPYFPPDQPTKFVHVHKVFGASNVAKILNDLHPSQREDAVNSLAYEAQARLNDPVLGCVGYIYLLEQKLNQIRHDLDNAKKELSTYIGPAAFGSFIPQPQNHSLFGAYQAQQFHRQPQGATAVAAQPPFAVPGMGIGMGIGLAAPATALPQAQMRTSDQQQHQQQQQQRMVAEAQQLAMVAAAASTSSREQEMLRSYEQQQELARFADLSEGIRGYNQMAIGGATVAVAAPQQGLALVAAQPLDTAFAVQQHQASLQFREQYRQPKHERSGSDEGRSDIGPSSS